VPHINQRLVRKEGFNGHYSAGLSERGLVWMADRKDQHISLLRGPHCELAARFKLPDRVDSSCRKAVDASGRVLVQAGRDADTICLDSEGHEISRSTSSGSLLTCFDDVLCYSEQIAGTYDYRIRLQRGADAAAAMYLEPPGRWGDWLSVCRHNNGTYCVADDKTRSLDIFDDEGQLPYMLLFHISLICCRFWHYLGRNAMRDLLLTCGCVDALL
jgi:hypothetical protein